MASDPLDSLTPTERLVLRSLLENRDQKTIARELKLSPETVKTHLRNAREKTGIRTSFALARALASHDAHPPKRVIPRPVGEPSPPFDRIEATSSQAEGPGRNDDAFHEERAVFSYDRSSFSHPAAPVGERRNPLTSMPRVLTATGLTILLIVVILLAFPLSQSFQRFADVLDPPKH
jgi:DNA-binding CsgD family transcriptional regulator